MSEGFSNQMNYCSEPVQYLPLMGELYIDNIKRGMVEAFALRLEDVTEPKPMSSTELKMKFKVDYGQVQIILDTAGRVASAGINAHFQYQGRDRRRIKREVRKAMDKARREVCT